MRSTGLTLRNQKYLLTKILKKLGNAEPNHEQIEFMSLLITSSPSLEQEVLFTHSLTERETSCLMLAAKGMTSSETAKLLGIKATTVETYRQNIKKKLACNTMAQAVFEGIRFGLFNSAIIR